MLKDYIQRYYFDRGYNCAETLLRAGNEYYGLELHDRDMIIVGAYGGGMQIHNTCGAMLGAIAILSMKYVEKKAHESMDINPVVTLFTEKMKTAWKGSFLCEDIRPVNFREGQRCLITLEQACDLLEETIKEYEESRAQ